MVLKKAVVVLEVLEIAVTIVEVAVGAVVLATVVVVVVVEVVVVIILAIGMTAVVATVRKKGRNVQARMIGGSSQGESPRPLHQRISRSLFGRVVRTAPSPADICTSERSMPHICFMYMLGPPVKTIARITDLLAMFPSNTCCCPKEMKVVEAVGPVAYQTASVSEVRTTSETRCGMSPCDLWAVQISMGSLPIVWRTCGRRERNNSKRDHEYFSKNSNCKLEDSSPDLATFVITASRAFLQEVCTWILCTCLF